MKLIFNILWLYVNNVNFTNTLPNRKDRNIEDFDDLSQLRTTTKRTEEEKNVNSKQMSVSSQQTCAKMALP